MAKKTQVPIARCADCALAQIHQWGKNPLVAFCQGDSGHRNVASTPIRCAMFKERVCVLTDNDIIHHKVGEKVS